MRTGVNPEKYKKDENQQYQHRVIVVCYIPNTSEDYYKESFEVFKLCIQSLIKTSHSKTFISVISNGSCDEVNAYISCLYEQKKIHEFTITKAIGKVNSILKGLAGNTLPIVTITDADVLFLNNWQKATYDVFEAFPKAGVVGSVPTPFTSFYSTANIFRLNLFKKNIYCSYVGALANDKIGDFFNQIDVLIIPSYEESGPLVGLEAMAAVKLIISTKVGAMEERLEGLRSFWFQIENIATLQAALEQVLSLNESERLMLSNLSRERYLCKYSLQAVSEKYKKITKQFIN